MKVIDAVKAYPQIDTSSAFNAARSCSNNFSGRGQQGYEDMILDLVFEPSHAQSGKEAELLFSYIVYEAVRIHHAGGDTDKSVIVPLAREKTREFLVKNPWAVPAPVITTEVVDGEVITTIRPKSKRGGISKKDLCMPLYEKNKDKSRKELIAIFVAELGLTAGGASTYVHNCKNNGWK